MLRQTFDTTTSALVTQNALAEDLNVLALLDWDHLPYELSQPGCGFRMSLLRGEDSDQALGILRHSENAPDILIVDEDFFGSPEAAADICMQIRRAQPDAYIIAIESEMWEGESVLAELGLCNETLPANATKRQILEKLRALN